MAYNVPIVDFVGPLTKIGENFGSMRREQKISEALAGLGPNASMADLAVALQNVDPDLSLKARIAGMKEVRHPKWQFNEDTGTYFDENADSPPPNPVTSADGSGAPVFVGKPTPAEKSVDTEFGKDYAAWKASGGYAGVEKQLDQLTDAETQLKNETSVTGPWMGMAKDSFIEPFINQKGISLRQQVEESVQSGLKAVLGSQYTEKEGERLLERTWNPSLEEGENLKRVQRVNKQLKAMAKAKESAANYYEKHGTLKGWKGPRISIDAIDPEKDTPNWSADEPPPEPASDIPQGAIDLLTSDPSPEAIQEFEETFGPGSARKYLRQ